MRGEIESDSGVLVIRRVHAHFSLRASEEAQPVVDRVHRVYADSCPLYRTLRSAIHVTSSYELNPETPT